MKKKSNCQNWLNMWPWQLYRIHSLRNVFLILESITLLIVRTIFKTEKARVLMQLGYEPGPVTVKGPGWTSVWGLLGKNEPTRYRAGVLTGYLRQANITDNLTTGLTMSICEVVASSCVQVRF